MTEVVDNLLEQAISSKPLIATPDTSVAEAIACMSTARAECSLFAPAQKFHRSTYASYILVMADNQLLGIFTARDAVRLSVQENTFDQRSLAEVMTRSVITVRQSELTDIFVAAQLFHQHHIRHLPVTDDDGRVIGVITHEMVDEVLRPSDFLHLQAVSEIMVSEVVYAFSDAPILHIAQLMAEHCVSSVIIAELKSVQTGADPLLMPIGIVTEGDIVQLQALHPNFRQIQTCQVMSAPVFSVDATDSLWNAQCIFQQKRIGRVIVTGDQGELIGIVTRSTLLRAMNPIDVYGLIDSLQQKVAQLEAEKIKLLQSHTIQLEEQIQQRTLALQQQAAQEHLLSAIATRIFYSLELQHILDAIVVEIQQFLQCDRVLIYQFNEDGSGMVMAEALLPGWSSAKNHAITDCCLQTKAEEFYARGRKHAVTDIYEAGYSDCYIQLLELYQVKSNLVMPILVKGKLWGLLIGQQCAGIRAWMDTELELLDRIAMQMAIAIQRSHAYEQAQRELSERRKTEEALKQSEATQRAILQSLPDLLIRTNIRGERIEFLSGGNARALHPPVDVKTPTVFDALPLPLAELQLRAIQQALITGELQTYEQRLEIDGQIWWEEVRVARVSQDEAIVMVRDISDRKQTEETNQAILKAMPDLLIQMSRKGKFQKWLSKGCIKTFLNLRTTEESLIENVLSDDLHTLRLHYAEQALQTGDVQTYEHQIEINGQLHYEEVRISPLNADEVLVIIRDITNRKQARAALVQSEAKHRALIHALPDLVMRMSEDGVYLDFFSTDTFKCFGDQSLIGRGIYDCGLPLDLAQLRMSYIQQALQTQQLQVYEQDITIDDETRTEEVHIAVCADHEVLVVVRDITDRKQAEAAFQKLVEGAAAIAGENFFTELVRYVAEVLNVRCVMIVTQATDCLKVSALCLDGKIQPNTTYSAGEIPCSVTIQQGEYICLSDVQRQFPNAPNLQIIDAEVYVGIALTNSEGKKVGCLCIIDHKPLPQPQFAISMLRVFAARLSAELERQTAIDALKHLNEELEDRIVQRTAALRQSEEWFRQIFEQSPVGIAITDLDGRLTRINSSFMQIMGNTKKNLLQQSIQEIFLTQNHPAELQKLHDLTEQTLPVVTLNLQLVSGRNNQIWVNTTSALLLNEFGRPASIIHLIEDVTEHKRFEIERGRAEAQLLKLMSLQNAILNSANYSIISTDSTGIIKVFNAAAQRMLGYTADEVIDRVTPAIIHDNTEVEQRAIVLSQELNRPIAPGFEVFVAKARQGEITEEEWTYIRKDGTRFPVQLSVTALRDRHGEITGFLGIAKDITQQKQAEAKLNHTLRELSAFKYALDEAAIVAITDAADTITYANQRFCEISKYSREEIIGSTHRLVKSGYHSEEFFADLWNTVSSGKTWRGEMKNRAKDGTEYWSDTTLVPFLDIHGKPFQYLAISTDITIRKQVEERVRQANDQLLVTNAELERATRLKDEFLANMSHELRTPLNAILGMTEGLQERVFGDISSAQARALTTIDRSGHHLLDLINDILDLAKIESGNLELQLAPAAVKYLCESSLTFVRQMAVSKNIRLTANIPDRIPDIWLDERRIRQVLINLLTNAVKFTPENGSVQLNVELQREDRERSILFEVRDTGIGIAPEKFSQLFRPFVQIDSSFTRQYAGTGLGLSLVQQLTQLHGGTVSLTSEVDKGSCFSVRIPYSCVLDSSLSSSSSPSHKTVLLLEDGASTSEDFVCALSDLDLNVTVHSAEHGVLSAAIDIEPVLIILNVSRSQSIIQNVLKQLNAHPKTQAIPIFIASRVEARSQSLCLGASDYLDIPLRHDQLRDVLSSLHILDVPSSDARSLTPSANDQPLALSESQMPRILLVEDNAANVATFSAYLKNRGYEVIVAGNGAEAIALTEAQHPDLILMDIQMPKVDGIAAIRHIRANPAIAPIPIIALTALAMPSDRENCIQAGVNDYITKPVKLKSLVETIQRLLSEVRP